MSDHKWIFLVYRIPREPTAGRVYIWRKLKQLDAVAIQDAVWVLPLTPKTKEHFQWLASEIAELGGEVRMWAGEMLYENGGEQLVKQFSAQVESEYREIIGELKKKNCDLPALARRYQQALARDYFQSELGETVRKKLLSARGDART